MMTYEIKKAAGKPDWETLPTLSMEHKYLDTPDDIRAYGQIAYGEDRLYVHLRTEEPRTRAVETDALGSPCSDSCLEFFFCPMEGDDRYFNIEFNSLGCIYCGMGSSVYNLLRLIPEEGTFGELFGVSIKTYESGWEIFYSVPYEFIRRFFGDFKVYEGKVMRANCYKCSDLETPSNYLSWSPIVDEPFRFHRPECFGEMVFI